MPHLVVLPEAVACTGSHPGADNTLDQVRFECSLFSECNYGPDAVALPVAVKKDKSYALPILP